MEPSVITLNIIGMHCTSCAMNIDFILEDLEGVKDSRTDYARQKSRVTYYEDKVTPKQMIHAIFKLGYRAVVQQ